MANRIKLFLKENRYILISGITAMFMILIMYIRFGIAPFGNNIIFQVDLYHQYGPLFGELYDRLSAGESLLYSWNTGLGSSFLGNFFNYLSSPISFIILLFHHDTIFEAVAIIIAIKVSLSSVSMAYYLKKSQKINSPIIIAFSMMYAFCGYFIAYHWNVMWTDALYLLPLVVLGIEKIIDSGKCANYILALAITMITNYYIAYMICIFSCVYFLYYFCISKERIDRKSKVLFKGEEKGLNKIKHSFFVFSGVRFAVSSLVSALISVFVFLPVAHVLSTSSATNPNLQNADGTTDLKIGKYFNVLQFLINHLAGVTPTIQSSGDVVLPNVYCGMLTVFLVLLYFMCKKITKREKIASITLLAFMYLSFNINVLNYVWHGFHLPNDMPYRQSFIYSFILITLACKMYKNIDFDKAKIWKYGFVCGLLIAFGIAVILINPIANATLYTIVFSAVLTIIFTVIFILSIRKTSFKKVMGIVLTCVAVIEIAVSLCLNDFSPKTKDDYNGDYDGYKAIQNEVECDDNDLFFRTEKTNQLVKMDPSWYGYNGISSFTSMASENIAILQEQLGLAGNRHNSYTYSVQPPVYNSMFSIKYIYDKKRAITENDYFSQVGLNTSFIAFENNYYLPLAYTTSNDLLTWNTSAYKTAVDAQEEYFRLATGVEDVYREVYNYDFTFENIVENSNFDNKGQSFTFEKKDAAQKANVIINIPAEKETDYYLYIASEAIGTASVYSDTVNNIVRTAFYDSQIIYLGKQNGDAPITVNMTLKPEREYADVDLIVFSVNHEKFVEGYNKLKEGQITITNFEETKISGNFVAKENQILYTSIPYDTYWSVYIDGKKAPDEQIVKISDALLGVKVSAGEHNITLKYETPQFIFAFVFSAIIALVSIALYVMNKKQMFFFKHKKENLWQRAEGELLKAESIDVVVPEIETPTENVEKAASMKPKDKKHKGNLKKK